MKLLRGLFEKRSRLVAGLMSGTSLDGVDAALVRIEGSGPGLHLEPLGFTTVPYPDDLRDLILANSTPESSSVLDISQLGVRIAREYERAVRRVAEQAGQPVSAIDLVGAHGQTIHHVPEPVPCAGEPVASTLQVGDPSALATMLRIPVVGGFRAADVALGGQGAPLVPYFDYVCFRDERETRGLLNIGGIANITIIPRGATRDDVFAFDTGPGNMVLDTLAHLLFAEPYDAGGRRAAQGRFDQAVMASLLEDDYFMRPPPRSTGREYFGVAYAERLVTRCREAMRNPTGEDVLATGTMLTVLSIYQAYARFVRERHPLDVLIASGGGVRNECLMRRLKSTFAPIRVCSVAHYGIDPDAKEALCFAVLAHEAVDGVPTGLPSVTGASRAAILGGIHVPT